MLLTCRTAALIFAVEATGYPAVDKYLGATTMLHRLNTRKLSFNQANHCSVIRNTTNDRRTDVILISQCACGGTQQLSSYSRHSYLVDTDTPSNLSLPYVFIYNKSQTINGHANSASTVHAFTTIPGLFLSIFDYIPRYCYYVLLSDRIQRFLYQFLLGSPKNTNSISLSIYRIYFDKSTVCEHRVPVPIVQRDVVIDVVHFTRVATFVLDGD